MPITPTYPGVYIEEVPSGVHTITGVATSIAAFVDYFPRGPMNQAVQLFNMADFERTFGGLDQASEASYGIQQFFINGGTEAWAVRVAVGATAADAQIDHVLPAAASALTVKAINEGAWGNNLRVRIDSNVPTAGEFNLVVSEYATVGNRVSVARQETFRNLSMVSTQSNFVEKVINDSNAGSKLVRVTASGANAPLANGTFSGTHSSDPNIGSATPMLSVSIGPGGGTPVTATATLPLPSSITLPGTVPLTTLAPVLEAAIRSAAPANSAFAGATVTVGGNQLQVLAGPGNPLNVVTFAKAGSDTTATDLKLTGSAVTTNIQEYPLGGGAVANSAKFGGNDGGNGAMPGATELIGNQLNKSGVFALEDVDLFNLLCIPRTAAVSGSNALTATQAQAVMSAAITYCMARRAFFLMDTPAGITNPNAIKTWMAANDGLRSSYAALYYPRIDAPDPLDNYRLRSFGASGTLAGLFARTDSARGVWKAPAGTEASLRNISSLDDALTDQENGALNPLAINCLRTFPIYGTVCWGARTLDGSDQKASEWKYIPVRRMALFLEESLYRGTKWVVFEPNDEPLWAQIRLGIGAFLHTLFRQGAFQGKTPRDAYFVKCDSETTTQADINQGIVNILVGFAPLKPAEFVIIRLQQMSGQIEV
ncbi:MAG TPA: phage tail sheath C-terminal domain-containing protein [Ktedonobacterales bacterium]|jgi:hypothetical protein